MVAIHEKSGAQELPNARSASRRPLGDAVGQRAFPPWANRLISVVIVLGAITSIAVTLPAGWALVAVAVLGICVAPGMATRREAIVTSLLAVAVGVTTIDYLTWRIEVSNWTFFGVIAAPLLAAEVFGALHTLGLQYTIWPKPPLKITHTDDPTRRPIFILIPTVNEGVTVLRPTVQAALEARDQYLTAFPHGEVVIALCNDGWVAGAPDWRDVESLAQRMGVTCVTRAQGGGAKAGNLEYARQTLGATGEALIVVFDADQIAHPDFLLKTAPWFTDRTIGWVQTGQYYRNLDQPVARWAHDQQALFYKVLCPGKSAHNAAFICGTNVMIQAAALDEIGGLPQDSVTEDFAASIRLHSRWRSVFLTDVLATGLGPMDWPSYLKQQRRWAIGTLSVLRVHWRDIILPRRGGLTLEQRIQYALACTHYLSGLRDLIFIISPLVFLATGIPAVRAATLGQFLWHFLPFWIASQAAFWYAGSGKTGLRGIVIGFGSFPALIQATWTVIFGGRSGFMVTSKRRASPRVWSSLGIYALATVACLAAVWLGFRNHALRSDSLVISILWVGYDLALLSSVLWLGMNDLFYREPQPIQRRVPVPSGARRLQPTQMLRPTRRLRPGWALAAAALIAASSSVLFASSHLAPEPATWSVTTRTASSPYLGLGLTLPVQSLTSRPAALESRVCLPFSIIGRTQTIQDSFDFAWARQLAAQNKRPWITLQFGSFNARGVPPLDASLPAIANGSQDQNLQRWAQDIHAYGQPIFLTFLLHVDRNWAVSSAVANGGIPQDAPRAWARIQSIFKAAGDTNVAWVWAPADPATDQAYAPPETSIDVVLQSMIRYPGTPWPDPVAVLSAVIARHPHKPIFVEISADGPAAEKAAWIVRVAAAAQSTPDVYALFYHDSSPDVRATQTENRQWSLESDPSSLQAVRSWQTLVQPATLPCGATNAARPRVTGPVQSAVGQPAARVPAGQSGALTGAWAPQIPFVKREPLWK
ncbi:MAG TPA: glycosyltransferase [Ktedonobacterales bacterium]